MEGQSKDELGSNGVSDSDIDIDIPRHLLRQMTNHIRRPERESPIQHPQTKHKPITLIPREILPLHPHKRIRILLCHRKTNDDTHPTPHQHQRPTRRLNQRQNLISVQQDGEDDSKQDEIRDKDVPAFELEVRVVERVHGCCLGGHDLDGCGGGEDPGEEVEPAGEEADDAAIAGSAGYGGPVVDLCALV